MITGLFVIVTTTRKQLYFVWLLSRIEKTGDKSVLNLKKYVFLFYAYRVEFDLCNLSNLPNGPLSRTGDQLISAPQNRRVDSGKNNYVRFRTRIQPEVNAKIVSPFTRSFSSLFYCSRPS